MKEKRIYFKSSDGVRLCGILAGPVKNAKGAVVLAHGITSEKNEGCFYRDLATLFAKNGLASLRFDFRGHGHSSGNIRNMTIKGEVSDVAAAVKLLKKRGHKKIAAVGTSFGGGITLLYAKKSPKIFSSITLLCPVLDYRRTFLEPETKWARMWFTPHAISRARKSGTLNMAGFQLGHALLREFHRHSPAWSLSKLKVPCLIIHGTEDDMVPHSVSSYHGRKHPRARFLSLKGAGHGLKGFEKEVFPKILKWILKNLNSCKS
ncbi:alpha/beta hydrolase family protein [Candidatus Omnitrophota bacterium]